MTLNPIKSVFIMEIAATAIIAFVIGLIGGYLLSGKKISFKLPVSGAVMALEVKIINRKYVIG